MGARRRQPGHRERRLRLRVLPLLKAVVAAERDGGPHLAVVPGGGEPACLERCGVIAELAAEFGLEVRSVKHEDTDAVAYRVERAG